MNTFIDIKQQKRKQVAQLSQRDRAAGWVNFGQKWMTGTGRQYFADIMYTLQHCLQWILRV